MIRMITAVAVVFAAGLCPLDSAVAQDGYYYAPPAYYAAPPVYAPYYAPPVYYAPAPVAVYRPVVVPAPAAAYPAPAYVAPYRVKYRSGPLFSKTEYEFYTPYGTREIEYRYDRWGNVSVDYDD